MILDDVSDFICNDNLIDNVIEIWMIKKTLLRFILCLEPMKLTKLVLFVLLVFIIWYWLYSYFSFQSVNPTLIVQTQTGILMSWSTISWSDYQKYTLDVWQRVSWHWQKVWGEHFWVVDAVSWNIVTNRWILVSGFITVDLNSISVQWLTGVLYNEFVNHLKNWFFETKEFPLSTIEIVSMTGIDANMIQDLTGFDSLVWEQVWLIINLTLHWITNQLLVPAVVEINDNDILIDSVFYIDRTQRWITQAQWVVDKYFWISAKLLFKK